MLAMLSVYLGLFNLLPLPALDGGRAVFLGVESVMRRRVDPRIEAAVHTAGFVLLFGVLLVVSVQGHLREGLAGWRDGAAGAEPRARGSAIHEGLVGERALVGTPYLADPELRHEYARDIAPRTRAALAKILAGGRSPADGGGARPGARPRARGRARSARRCARISAPASTSSASDRVAAPGVVTANLDGRAAGGRRALRPHRRGPPAGRAVRRCPSEERIDERARRVRAWTEELLAPGGTVILVEPALRETSRELLAVRDQLLALSRSRDRRALLLDGRLPGARARRDWCHDATVGRRRSPSSDRAAVDFSYLALRDRWKPLAGPAALPRGQRSPAGEGPAQAVRLRPDRPPRLHPPRPQRVAAERGVREARPRRRRPHRRRATEANDGMRVEATTAVAKRSPPRA